MKKMFLVMAMIAVLAFFAFAEEQEDPNDPHQGPELVGNSVCPVSGNPVGGKADNPTFHSDFKGYRIGFMCPMCKATFDKADKEGKEKLLEKALKSVGKEEKAEE